jgi:hypothetical protein
MQTAQTIETELRKGFTAKQSSILSKVIFKAHSELVKADDFNELKEIVRDIGVKVGELAEAQIELAEAQKGSEARLTRLEASVEKLAKAQEKTEKEIRKLVIGLNDTRKEVGSFSKTVSYAFENEAYRNLPKVLGERYGIKVKDKVLRAEIGGKEINIFARAEREGKEVIIVGEVKLKLDEKIERYKRERDEDDVYKELDDKVEAVKAEYSGIELLRILVCHFATKGFIKEAEEKGTIVVQSFEW